MTDLSLPATLAVRAEPVQQRSADRITNLLDAAADLIDERGIDGLTTSDVATRSRDGASVSGRLSSSPTRARQASNSPSFESKYRLMRATFTPASAAMSRTVVER